MARAAEADFAIEAGPCLESRLMLRLGIRAVNSHFSNLQKFATMQVAAIQLVTGTLRSDRSDRRSVISAIRAVLLAPNSFQSVSVPHLTISPSQVQGGCGTLASIRCTSAS